MHGLVGQRTIGTVCHWCGSRGIQLSAASSGLSRNFGDGSALANGREMPLGAFGLGMTHCGPANNGGPALPAWRRPPKT